MQLSMKKNVVSFIAFFILVVFSQSAWGQTERSKMAVFVSILPQTYFLERIGGDCLRVEVLVGEGQSPGTYEPTPKQMAKLSEARACFLIGVPFERNLMKKLRQSHWNPVIVKTQKGVPYRYLAGRSYRDEPGHGTGQGWESAGVPDPHIWMSPKLVKIQAQNIYDALSRLDPVHKQQYAQNLQSFHADLNRLDARIARSLAPIKGKKMYVFHPAFGYFADAYGLIQVPIEIEGKEPGGRQLVHLIDMAKKDGVKVIFVQPQFSRKSAEVVAKAIGGAVVPINPLSKEYIVNLEKMAAAVEQGLR
jgi:zinc transport system substrate-binding protein